MIFEWGNAIHELTHLIPVMSASDRIERDNEQLPLPLFIDEVCTCTHQRMRAILTAPVIETYTNILLGHTRTHTVIGATVLIVKDSGGQGLCVRESEIRVKTRGKRSKFNVVTEGEGKGASGNSPNEMAFSLDVSGFVLDNLCELSRMERQMITEGSRNLFVSTVHVSNFSRRIIRAKRTSQFGRIITGYKITKELGSIRGTCFTLSNRFRLSIKMGGCDNG